MSELKLAKLPDRTSVKITIAATPELDQALRDYATVYSATYGASEAVAELIPFMLTAFIDADARFKKARRELLSNAATGISNVPPLTQPRTRHVGASPETSSSNSK